MDPFKRLFRKRFLAVEYTFPFYGEVKDVTHRFPRMEIREQSLILNLAMGLFRPHDRQSLLCEYSEETLARRVCAVIGRIHYPAFKFIPIPSDPVDPFKIGPPFVF